MITPMRSPWKGTMTGRERFNAQMNGKSFDRTVNREFGYWKENFSAWKIFSENGITNNAEAERFFSFDKMASCSISNWIYPKFEHRTISDDGKIKVIMNGDGVMAEVASDGHSSIPHYTKPSVVTPEDWKRVKAERMKRDDPHRIPNIAAIKAKIPDDRDFPAGIHVGSLIGVIRDMLTFEGLCYAQYDYPDMLEDMIENITVFTEDALDRILPHFHFDFAEGWEDICFKNGPIVTVDFFRAVLMPRYKRIGKKLSEHGVKVWWMDCDGDVRPILPYFLEAGVNCLFPYEVNSCCHPAELMAMYPGALKIMGGFDKMQLIAGKDAIRSYMRSIEKLVASGGYIPFCDHRCPPDVSEENYLYYLDLKEKTFGIK